MANSYFNASGVPVNRTAGTSLSIRNEFSAIESGFTLNEAHLALKANLSGGNTFSGTQNMTAALSSSSTIPTASPGTATTQPASTEFVALSILASYQSSIVGISGSVSEFNGALIGDDFVTLTGIETLSNKTLVSPALGTPASGNLSNCTFPTLNQSTTGSAATLTTPRTIYGNNFDGSANLTQVIASTYGGTGNGFTKFSGATTSEKTYTLPDQAATIVTNLDFGSNVATFLATPSSANLSAAITDETGSGALVFGTSPNITTSLTTGSSTFSLVNANATTVNFAGAATTLSIGAGSGTTTVNNNLTVTGNLTINGTTEAINSTVTTIVDPIIDIGGGTNGASPTSDDSKDRGIKFQWHNGSVAKNGFFGWDRSAQKLTFVPDATITGEVISGTVGSFDLSQTSSINKVTVTAPATSATLTISDGKTLTVNNSITLAGTDSTTITLPSTTGTVPLNNQTFYLGTTALTINRSSATQALTGITSIDGSAATLTTARTIDGQSFNGSANITVIAPGTNAATSKTTPVDADEIPLTDSATSFTLKKLTWANLKATTKTYFDTLYLTIGGALSGTTLSTTGSNTLGDTALTDLTTFPDQKALRYTTSVVPTSRPALLLDFENSQQVDPRITFTRASSATRVNKEGFIELVSSNTPRIDYDPVSLRCKGLLIEEQRTNLLTYSEQFDNAAWTKTRSSISANAAVAPDGTLTAVKLVEDATASNTHFINCSTTISNTTTYTWSWYAKAAERTWIVIDAHDGSTNKKSYFNLSSGVVGTSAAGNTASITSVGNGWYRCSISRISAGTASFPRVGIASADATETYTGDGTSGIYIWGAQLEVGAFPTTYIPSTETFTSRASTATYFGSNGLIQSASSNVARMNYNPVNLTLAPKLLLEEQRTNLLTYSEQFDNAAINKTRASISANATTAPDGTLTADKLVEDSSSNTHYVYYNSISISANTLYTFTIFLKSAERTFSVIELSNDIGTNSIVVGINLATGVLGTPFIRGTASNPLTTITACQNGWYRISVTGIVDNSSTMADMTIYSATSLLASGYPSYTGDGTSGLYIWGAQLEAGSYPTSYIPTTSATVTRSADVSSSAATTRSVDNATITGTNFSSWYKQDEGTLFAKADVPYLGGSGYPGFLAVDDTTTNNAMYLGVNDATNDASTSDIKISGTSQATISPKTYTAGSLTKATIAYKLNNSQCVYDGTAGTTDTSCSIPIVTRLLIGNTTTASYPLNGHIYKISYYPKRLSDTELQGLTS